MTPSPAAGDPGTPPAPRYTVGQPVTYTSSWPRPQVQHGVVVALEGADSDMPRVGWFTGISGPIAPDDPRLSGL